MSPTPRRILTSSDSTLTLGTHFDCPRSPALPLPVPSRLGPHSGVPIPRARVKGGQALLGTVLLQLPTLGPGLEVKMETLPWISSPVAGDPGRRH